MSDLQRLLGVRDGYISGILVLKNAIGRLNHSPIPKHHTRRLAQRKEVERRLREPLDRLHSDLQHVKAALSQRGES